MSQLYRIILGAVAVSLTCGAVQFASGRDLSGVLRNSPDTPETSPSQTSINETSINRAAKADRAGRVAGSAAQTQTISLRLNGLSETSIVVRIPAGQEARNTPAAPPASLLTKSGNRRLTVACEPVVSVLTEIAKQLQPGRCVT